LKNRALRGVFLVVLSFAGLVFFPQMLRPVAASTLWGSPTAIENNAGINILNAGLQANNGTMWLAWQTNRYRGDSQYDISYKTNTNGIWSPVSRLTTSGNNAGAALAQLSNGTILLFWAYKPAASYLIYYRMYNSPGGWSNAAQVSSTTLNDTNPSATVGRDGTLWVIWTRTNSSCSGSCTDVSKQLYYKTLKTGVWSTETKLTSDTNQNWGAGVSVGKDNLVRVVWSKGLGSLENYQVYYKTYNTSIWSTETKVATSTSSDEHPMITQDRNGTMWLFWSRKFYYSGLAFHYILFSKYSYNSGTTWSAETQMTNTSNSVDSMQPYGVQSTYNKSIWLFYTTNPSANDDIYALISSPISPIHDVTITAVTASTRIEYFGGLPSMSQSEIVSVTVTVLNRGDQSEIVTVNLSIYNSTSYNMGTKQNLAVPGGTVNLVFNWNATAGKLGLYSALATVNSVAGETAPNQADNNLISKGITRVIPWGDINQDGTVALTDVSVFFFDYGFGPAGAPCVGTHCTYFPLEDINNSGAVDIIDVGIAAKNYGIIS